ncbi:transporter [Ideonella sp. A 288]|uniref:transporter n=1 Tax=Ideonella sp. A 288 TaxID=1962181 RepID=UPI000B4B9F6C|nr:transporter [Ideonella sp. A 288]
MASAKASLPYGSDDNGLICGYLFREGGAGQPVEASAAIEWLRSGPPQPSGVAWLHFNLSHARAEAWLRDHAELPDEFFAALREGSRASRIHRDGDTVFAVINDVTFDFSFDAAELATLWVSVRQGLVVSARRHPLRSVDRLRASVKRGEVFDSGIGLLDHLLRDQADELQLIVRKAGERVDDIEDAMLARHAGRHGTELSQLRRLAVRLNRLMSPEPGALQRVVANPPYWVQPPDAQRLREAGDDFGVALRDVASLQDRIKLLQDEASSRVAEENNRSLFLLTMVTVLALPINLSAGLLGMNVGGIPLAQHPEGFWVVVAVIGAFTAATGWLAWRRLAPRD